MDSSQLRNILSRDLTHTLIRLGVLALLVAACVQIVQPFVGVLLWALILAIALYPLQQRLARRLGSRQGLAAGLIVTAGVVGMGVPLTLLGTSFAAHLDELQAILQQDTLVLPKPDPAIAEWPLIGERLYAAWAAAATDLPGYLAEHRAELQSIARGGFRVAASTAGAIGLFLAALIVSAIMMAYAKPGSAVLGRIFCRLTDPELGLRLQTLSTATVRSVASGVIGVAFVQALLLGIGFLFAGIPAAGVLAFAVMFIGILQLPALIVSLPVIAYLWWSGDGSTTVNAMLTVYLIVAGMADNVLKPLLLGRGVESPMAVVLLGALGGMVWFGIVGLFVGAVLLAVGYQLLMEWVDGLGEASAQES
ncbi:MAG: AI-2E family transporter [Pseudomonadales bacterium]